MFNVGRTEEKTFEEGRTVEYSVHVCVRYSEELWIDV
jgi:hypothetical protein